MDEKTRNSSWIILPVCVVGLALVGLIQHSGPQEPDHSTEVVISPAEESRIVSSTTDQSQAPHLDTVRDIGLAERKLLLRRNADPRRRLEIAAGLYDLAVRYLDLAQASEALRAAQLAADQAPESLIAARSWVLAGHASAVMHPDLPISIRHFERADKLLLARLQRYPDDAEALQLRAAVVLKLALNQAHIQQAADAIQTLQQLVGESPESQVISAVDRLQALLALGQLYRLDGRIPEGDAWLSRALEYGRSGEVPAQEALHTLNSHIHLLYLDQADPIRQDQLRVLWNTPQFEGLPEWFEIGDELASSDFFHDPSRTADFELVSRQLRKSLQRSLEQGRPETGLRDQHESLYATHLLLAAESARRRGDTAEVSRLVGLFEGKFAGRHVNFVSPLDRPAQRLAQLGEIYRTIMTSHAEQMRSRQASGEHPASR